MNYEKIETFHENVIIFYKMLNNLHGISYGTFEIDLCEILNLSDVFSFGAIYA